MPKIQTYNDAEVIVLRSTSNPGVLTKRAIDLTQKRMANKLEVLKPASRSLCRFILDAKHGSVIEHCNITLLLRGVSRSFLAQITRHRIGSFTSASQHYRDYRDYPMVVYPEVLEEAGIARRYTYALDTSLDIYTELVDTLGVPPEEARQVLPNASAVDIIWSVNARALENFFYQRLCRRNVAEMRIVSEKIYREACNWWPELFTQVGPACFRSSCDQGKMSCGRNWCPTCIRCGDRHSGDCK